MTGRPTAIERVGRKSCKVCQTIAAGDTKLERRINSSRTWVPGGESLKNIARDYEGKFLPQSLYTHAKKHQAPNKRKLEAVHAKIALQQIVEEQAITEVKQVRHYSDDLSELKAIGMELVRKGGTQVSAAVLAKLIDIEVKIEEKQKDRDFEMTKMVAYFASGAGRPDRRFNNPIVVEPEAVEAEVIG